MEVDNMYSAATCQLAERFIDKLREELGTEKLKEVVKRNFIYPKDTCATHDFIDANMVMYESFKEVMGYEPEFVAKQDAEVWNTAWDLARAAHFYIPEEQLLT